MPDEAYHVFDRIAIRDVFDDVGSKYVPPHVNIFYCFGGLVFTSFIAQVTTGAAMTFYYVPEVSRSDTSPSARRDCVRQRHNRFQARPKARPTDGQRTDGGHRYVTNPPDISVPR